MMSTLYRCICQYWLLLTVLLMAAITALSLTPLPQLPDVPGTDKTHHAIAYAALAFPVSLRQPRFFLWIIILMVGYGGLIELIQPYVNRYGEWLDFAANTAGVGIGVLLGRFITKYKNNDVQND